MKNILVLAPTPSHPQDAGNRKRIFALTKYLQELGGTIYFVYCPREWDREIPKDAYDGMNKCWDYFFVAYPVQPAVHRTDDEYFELDAWWDVGIEFTVNWIKLAVDFDIVLCNYVFYSKVLELFDQSVTKVIDTHDIVSNRNYLLDRKLGYRDFFYVSPESEKKALQRAHLVLSIKEDESSWFKCLSDTPVLTIGHLEPEPSEICNREIDYDNIKLGFIGSANPINVRNLESFLDQYLSKFGNYSDRLTFIVGGKVCDVLDARFRDRVKIIGKVKDVSEFYEQVDIVVLPFEFSTGLKIKTVEALSWSKPCIGTINAFEGLGSNCQYHSFKTIEELALRVEDILQAPQSTIAQLKQDSQSVYINYSNSVKKSIEKLYQINWKAVKKLQSNSSDKLCIKIKNNDSIVKTVYNFNLVTNIDFWKSKTNQALWINFWINNARKIGNINIFRTRHFQDMEADKLELYKLGLVNNVHYRELYQIIDLFKISPDANQVFINLLDFSSVILDECCLEELDQLQLAVNHYFGYFFDTSSIDINQIIKENVCQILEKNNNQRTFYLWDLDRSWILDPNFEQGNQKNIVLTENLINLNQAEYDLNNLDKVIIGTYCLDISKQTELNRLIICCQDFMPEHFQLVVFSDLNLPSNPSVTRYPLQAANQIIPKVDIFICIENPKIMSFLIYLCLSNRIPIYSKNKEFYLDEATGRFIKPIENFTFIPQAYKSFLETLIRQEEADQKTIRHRSWKLFLEYWLAQNPSNSKIPENNYLKIH